MRCEHSRRKRQLFVDLDIRLFEDGAHVDDCADINGWASVLDASYRRDLKAVRLLVKTEQTLIVRLQMDRLEALLACPQVPAEDLLQNRAKFLEAHAGGLGSWVKFCLEDKELLLVILDAFLFDV
jgi:hypothetical protein